jgi:hypothetical protein
MPSIRQKEESAEKSHTYALLAICFSAVYGGITFFYDTLQIKLIGEKYKEVFYWVWWALGFV